MPIEHRDIRRLPRTITQVVQRTEAPEPIQHIAVDGVFNYVCFSCTEWWPTFLGILWCNWRGRLQMHLMLLETNAHIFSVCKALSMRKKRFFLRKPWMPQPPHTLLPKSHGAGWWTQVEDPVAKYRLIGVTNISIVHWRLLLLVVVLTLLPKRLYRVERACGVWWTLK